MGLTATEARLALKRGFTLLLLLVDDVLVTFSLSSFKEGRNEVENLVLGCDGTEDGGGKKFVILRNGCLCFEGPTGGLFSVLVIFCAACLEVAGA